MDFINVVFVLLKIFTIETSEMPKVKKWQKQKQQALKLTGLHKKSYKVFKTL